MYMYINVSGKLEIIINDKCIWIKENLLKILNYRTEDRRLIVERVTCRN